MNTLNTLKLLALTLLTACGARTEAPAPLTGCGVDPFAGTLSFQGHRASSVEYPNIVENSLGSLLALLTVIPQTGDHRVEFDVSTTLDGQLVLLHDIDTCRVSDTSVRPQDTLYADLPLLKDGQKIPLLSEVVEVLVAHDASDLHVNFDLKRVPASKVEELGDMIEAVADHHKTMMYVAPWTKPQAPALCKRFAPRLEVLDYFGPNGDYCGYEYAPTCARICTDELLATVQ